MAVSMRAWTLLAVIVGVVHCNTLDTFDVEKIHDTCSSIASYMKRKDLPYSQIYSEEPDVALNICGSGYTCCNQDIENLFLEDVTLATKKGSYKKFSYYSRSLNDAKGKIGEYITQVLTMIANINHRTKRVVDEYLEMSQDDLLSIDELEYPVSVLLDIAESNGVKNTDLMNSTACIREMQELLVPLVNLQKDGLELARLLYQAIPKGVSVLDETAKQDIGTECLNHLTRSQKCNSCLDKTNEQPCRDYCLAITEKCFSHLKIVSEPWEEFARLTELTMDGIDRFAQVYRDGLAYSIQAIGVKLQDHDTADMCGFNIANSLEARRHKRAASKKKTRDVIFNTTSLIGMLGNLDEMHCNRYSTRQPRCWNGTEIGQFSGNSDNIEITNDVNVTEALTAALKSVEIFNKEYKKVESIEIEGAEYNVEVATEAPVFNKNDANSAQTALISLGLFSVSLLLH